MFIDHPASEHRWKTRRRRAAGLTQREEATVLGISTVTASHLETGKRGALPELLKTIHEVYAYGERSAAESPRPVFLLATIPVDPTEPETFLSRADGSVGYFLSFELADLAAALLRRAGLADTLAVPAWPNWIAGLAVELTVGDTVRVAQVDEAPKGVSDDAAGTQMAKQIFEHVAACLDSPSIAVDLQQMLAHT